MNATEAKRVLLLYRPGSADASDPEIAEALRLVEQEPDLRLWFEEHCAFQAALRGRFQDMDVPADLKNRIIASRKIIRPPFWSLPSAWLAAAAAVLLLVSITAVMTRPRPPDRFAAFEARMVGTALREYRMDVVTNDMTAVRRFVAEKGAPADYTLPTGLRQLQLTGGGVLRWRNNPVAMVCFDRGDEQMLFLFVMDGSAVKDPPPPTPAINKVNRLRTASWSADGKTYLLAGPDEPGFERKYL